MKEHIKLDELYEEHHYLKEQNQALKLEIDFLQRENYRLNESITNLLLTIDLLQRQLHIESDVAEETFIQNGEEHYAKFGGGATL